MNTPEPTIEKKYSVREIDEMRKLARKIWHTEGMIAGQGGFSWSESAERKSTETRLHTYMLAGVTVEDLQQRANDLDEDLWTAIQKREANKIDHAKLVAQWEAEDQPDYGAESEPLTLVRFRPAESDSVVISPRNQFTEMEMLGLVVVCIAAVSVILALLV